MATHNSSKLPGYLCAEKPVFQVGARAGLQQNYGVADRNSFLYSIAIVVAGLVACWAASLVISAVEIIVLSQIWPAEFAGGPNLTAKVAMRIGGCMGLMVGGYVSAWFASRARRSELNHALVVGCIYGVLGVLSHDERPISLMLACVVFFMAVMGATLGGWLRDAQVRRQRATVLPSRFK